MRQTFQTTFLLKLPLPPTAGPGSLNMFDVVVSAGLLDREGRLWATERTSTVTLAVKWPSAGK